MTFRSPSGTVLGLRVDRVDYAQAVDAVVRAAEEGRAMRVAAANVHVVMEARDDPALASLLGQFELVVPDGQPVRWALDAGADHPLPDRVYGPELMRRVVRAAASRHLSIYLYGATTEIVSRLAETLRAEVPGLEIAGVHAPGFGPALWREAETDLARIRDSGARIVFVALGCPRQERWVGLHGARLGAPCLAVGAAFELLAGTKRMAPAFLQKRGLEWAYRLATEPRRTWRRYAIHNPRFVVGALSELWSRRAGR